MSENRVPFHFGGPMGLAGLALLAGAAGIVVVASGQDVAPAVTTGGTEQGEEIVAETPIDKPDVTVPIVGGPDAVEVDPAEPDVVATPQVAQSQARPRLSEPAPRVEKSEPAKRDPLPAAGQRSEVTFIVRIKGGDEPDVIARNFKRDREMANSAYKELVKRQPVLADFDLVGASYSGDLKLAYRFPAGKRATPDAVEGVRKMILSVEGVAYADPDRIAQPGKDPR